MDGDSMSTTPSIDAYQSPDPLELVRRLHDNPRTLVHFLSEIDAAIHAVQASPGIGPYAALEQIIGAINDVMAT